MCGFVLLCNRRVEALDPCVDIRHRGPDSVGHRTLSSAGWSLDLHFRRLAIVDLDARSDQPFGDAGTALLLYNGELYNTDELRRLLAGRGVHFRTTGDTEVLYWLLLEPDWSHLLSRVDGMFAFVLSLPSGELRYGRDRFGIKPLYQASVGSGRLLGLSSEIRPLRSAGLAEDIDQAAVAAAAMFLWVPPPATGWRNCVSIAPGSAWTREPPDFDTARLAWSAPLPTSQPMDIGTSVRVSVERQAHADVPVALLLSGGLDSSWLAVELARGRLDVPFLAARTCRTFDADAEPFEEDAPYADRVARQLSRDVRWSDLDAQLLKHIPDMVRVLEQPFGDPAAISLMRLAEAASRQAKVLLSGVGVEELFLGYERHQAIKALSAVRWSAPALRAGTALVPLPRRLRERAAKFSRLLEARPADWTWVSQSYLSQAEWSRLSPKISLDEVVGRHRQICDQSLASGQSILAAAAETDRQLFLPGLNLLYADRASMQASVELRVPFLGEPVVAAALQTPPSQHVRLGNGKRAFRLAAEAAGVPSFVVKRSKTGFGAPVRSIMRQHGMAVWGSVRTSGIFEDLFDARVVDQMFRDHTEARRELGLPLFGLTSLAVWWDENVNGSSAAGDELRCLGTSIKLGA